MAIRKTPPDHTKSAEREFSTRQAAEEFKKTDKEKNKQMGVTARYDIELNPKTNQWRVKIDYYL
jgi:hypothetical protein